MFIELYMYYKSCPMSRITTKKKKSKLTESYQMYMYMETSKPITFLAYLSRRLNENLSVACRPPCCCRKLFTFSSSSPEPLG